MKKWFAFEVRSSGEDKLGRTSWHWVVTSKYATKKEVMEAYNTKRCLRRVRYVYTLKQLLVSFGKQRTKQILEETKPFWIGEYNCEEKR